MPKKRFEEGTTGDYGLKWGDTAFGGVFGQTYGYGVDEEMVSSSGARLGLIMRDVI